MGRLPNVLSKALAGLLVGSAVVAAFPALAGEAEAARVIYSLPFDESYKDFTSYSLALRIAEVDETQIVVRYEVPPDLIGRDERYMTMIGSLDGGGEFIDLFCGETGSVAKCVRAEGRFSCSVKFHSLGAELGDVESYLRAKYGDDGHLAARMSAAEVFKRDAIGTLDIAIP